MPLLWTWLIFVFVLGCCIGSFLNVVIYRVPAGKSIVFPPSHCPRCSHQIAWYDNLPILSWLVLGAKCRQCKTSISAQYPAIELLTGLLFAGVFYVLYLSPLRKEFPNTVDSLYSTWPVLVAYLALLGSLLAATVVDARLYIIPLSIVWVPTVLAAVLMPMGSAVRAQLLIDLGLVHHAKLTALATGAVAGLILSNVLLHFGLLPRSFDEDALREQMEKDKAQGESQAQPESSAAPAAAAGVQSTDAGESEQWPEGVTPPDQWLEFPNPRLEAAKELLFLALPILLALAAYMATPDSSLSQWRPYPWGLPLHTLAGVALGYLVGGGLIWITRILGTLGFGKEAMGMGDVHLLAAVGAVLGPVDTVLVFFIAPFIGLFYAGITYGFSKLLTLRYRPIPYGPHLCLATLIVIVGRSAIVGWLVKSGIILQ